MKQKQIIDKKMENLFYCICMGLFRSWLLLTTNGAKNYNFFILIYSSKNTYIDYLLRDTIFENTILFSNYYALVFLVTELRNVIAL